MQVYKNVKKMKHFYASALEYENAGFNFYNFQ